MELIFFEFLGFFYNRVSDIRKRSFLEVLKVVERFSLRIDDDSEFFWEVFDEENIKVLNFVIIFIEIIGKEVFRNYFGDKSLRV
jgi:hypothetical protein